MPDRPTFPPVGPFHWPPAVSDCFPVAVMRGLARVGSAHPAALDALHVAPADLVIEWPDGERPKADPAYGQYVGAPLMALLARIGYAEPLHPHPQLAVTLGATALLVLEWSYADARCREGIDDAMNKGCLSVRRWWEPKGDGDAIPAALVQALPPHGIGLEDVPRLVQDLATRADGTPRLDNFLRLISFLAPLPERRPRLRRPGAEATGPIESDGPRGGPAGGWPDSDAQSRIPPAPITPPTGDLCPTPYAPPREPTTVGEPVAVGTDPDRRPPPHKRSYIHGLPNRHAREADAIRVIRGGPSQAGRRAQAAADHVLPHARPDDLHAVDWTYLTTWASQATHLERAVVLALVYSGQSPAALAQWQIGQDLAVCAADPGHCWLVLSPFCLAVPNRVNPHLPTGPNPPSAQVLLPFPQPVAGQPAHRLERLRRVASERAGGRLADVDELQAIARRFDEAAMIEGSAMRLHRLSRVLERVLFNQTGSALVWQYIRNAPPDVAYLPALHYARFERQELADAYGHARDRIDALLGGPVHPGADAPLPLQGFVGSGFCPTDEALRSVLLPPPSALRPGRGAPTLAKLTAFHNAFVRHTLGLLMVATGIRTSQAGLASLQPLDLMSTPVQALWKINDKRQLGTGGRVLPVPPTALVQHQAYQKHRRWIIDHRLLAPAIATWRNCGEPLPFWFFFDEDGHIQPATPRRWARAMEPLKENATRHWMLNALRRAGWPADRIAVFAGHEGRVHGQTGAWTTLPPWTLEEQGDVEQILAVLGLQAHEGMGDG